MRLAGATEARPATVRKAALLATRTQGHRISENASRLKKIAKNA